MRDVFLLLGIVVFCLSCEGNVEQVVISDGFFDLKEYMATEQERLVKDKVKLEKTITLNGKEETKVMDNPNYEVEFSEFLSSDINRVAWLDKYEEVKKSNGIHYTAKDEKLEVRNLDIQMSDNKQVSHVSIRKKTKNMLNDTRKELAYTPKGYRIKNVRKSIGESADTLVIAVKFLD